MPRYPGVPRIAWVLLALVLPAALRAGEPVPTPRDMARAEAEGARLAGDPRDWWTHEGWAEAMKAAGREGERVRTDAARAAAAPADPYFAFLAARDVWADHPGEAREMVEAAARAAPGSPWGPFGLAGLLEEPDPDDPNPGLAWRRSRTERRALARRALELDPGFWPAHRLLADLAEGPAALAEALTHGREAARLAGERSGVILALADDLRFKGYDDEEYGEDEIEGSGEPEAAPGTASAAASPGTTVPGQAVRDREAEACLRRALELDRGWGPKGRAMAVESLASLLRAGPGGGAAARELIEREHERDPEDPAARIRWARELAEAGELDRARALVRAVPWAERDYFCSQIERMAAFGEGHRSVRRLGNELRFEIALLVPPAEAVEIALESDRGIRARFPLGTQGVGRYAGTRQLPPGTYTYQVMAGGSQWPADPCAPDFVDRVAAFRVGADGRVLAEPRDELESGLARLAALPFGLAQGPGYALLAELLRKHPGNGDLLGVFADQVQRRGARIAEGWRQRLPAEVLGNPAAMAYLEWRARPPGEDLPVPAVCDGLAGARVPADRFWAEKDPAARARRLLAALAADPGSRLVAMAGALSRGDEALRTAVLAAAGEDPAPVLAGLLAPMEAAAGRPERATGHWRRALAAEREPRRRRARLATWVEGEKASFPTTGPATRWLEPATRVVEEFPEDLDLVGLLEALPGDPGSRASFRATVATALATHPDSSPLLHLLAHCEEADEAGPAAIAALERAFAAGPRDPRAAGHLGRSLMAAGRIREAQAPLRIACNLQDPDSGTRTAFAASLFLDSDLGPALRETRDLIEAGGTPEQLLWAHRSLAWSELTRGRGREAFRHARHVLAEVRKDPAASLGEALAATAILVAAGTAAQDRGKLRAANDALAEYPLLPWLVAGFSTIPIAVAGVLLVPLFLLFRSWAALRSIVGVLGMLALVMLAQGLGTILAGAGLHGQWLLPYVEMGKGRGAVCGMIGYGVGAIPMAAFALAALRRRGEGLATLDVLRPPRLAELWLAFRVWLGLALLNGALIALLLLLVSSVTANALVAPAPNAEPIRAGLLFPAGLWATVLMIAVMAPVAEELFFRGYVYRRWEPLMGKRKAAFLSALLFSVIHMGSFVQLFFAGLAFVWLLERRGSLWPPILAHMILNSVALLALGSGM